MLASVRPYVWRVWTPRRPASAPFVGAAHTLSSPAGKDRGLRAGAKAHDRSSASSTRRCATSTARSPPQVRIMVPRHALRTGETTVRKRRPHPASTSCVAQWAAPQPSLSTGSRRCACSHVEGDDKRQMGPQAPRRNAMARWRRCPPSSIACSRSSHSWPPRIAMWTRRCMPSRRR